MASSRLTGTNEDIDTYGSNGRDYDDGELSVWEAATDNDNVTATTSPVLECYDDQASYADAINMGGATNNSSYFRMIRAASGQGHDGTPNNGVTFVHTSSIIFLINEDYDCLQDIIGISTYNDTAAHRGPFNSNGKAGWIIGCIGKSTNAGSGVGQGLEITSGASVFYAINNLFYECKTVNISFVIASGHTAYCYNNTSIDSVANGIIFDGNPTGNGTIILTNNLSTGSGGSDFSSSVALDVNTVTYNASGDDTADDWDGQDGSGNNRVNQSGNFSFVASGSDNWHLASDDAGAIGYGVDLSGDGDFAFDDDIDGETRSSWDIGFDEYIAAGVGINLIPFSIYNMGQR